MTWFVQMKTDNKTSSFNFYIDDMRLSISKGNTKLGKIPNFSLPPLVSCFPNIPCRDACYAIPTYKMYAATRKQWDDNFTTTKTLIADGYKHLLFNMFLEFMNKFNPPYFRIAVSGDFRIINDDMTRDYINVWRNVAEHTPETKYLVFTKAPAKFHIPKLPNLKRIWSAWNGAKVRNDLDGIAWYKNMQTPDKRIPRDALPCAGACHDCMACWVIENAPSKSVYFEDHNPWTRNKK